MKRFTFWASLAAIVAVPAVSPAAFINLNLDDAYKVVSQGSATTLTFSGSVTVRSDFDVVSRVTEFAGLTTSGPFLSNITVAPSFTTYLSGYNPGVTYTGDFFTVTLDGTEAVGLYAFNGATVGDDDMLAEISLTASNGAFTAKDSELYAIEVVPEPASMAALAVGAAALLRKRRK